MAAASVVRVVVVVGGAVVVAAVVVVMGAAMVVVVVMVVSAGDDVHAAATRANTIKNANGCLRRIGKAYVRCVVTTALQHQFGDGAQRLGVG